MNYLVLVDENDNTTIISPIPPNHDQYVGTKLILESIPPLPIDHKYILTNGSLTTSAMSVQETETKSNSKLKASYQEANYVTDLSLEDGFTYSGESFSLSPLLREHWTRLYVISQLSSLGNTSIPTLSQTTFQLNSANIDAFYSAFSNKMSQIIEADRLAKLAIKNNQ